MDDTSNISKDDQIKELRKALSHINLLVDEQVDRVLVGAKPNWKRAVLQIGMEAIHALSVTEEWDRLSEKQL